MSDLQQLSSVALSSLRDGVMALDARGTILVLNHAAGALLGISPAQALGTSVRDALGALPHADAFLDAIFDAITTNQPQIQQHMQLEVGGRQRTIEVTTSRLSSADAAGGAAGIVMLLRDVTEVWELAVKQSALSIELEDSNQQLQKAVRELEQKSEHLTDALRRIKALRVAGLAFFIVLIAVFGWYSSGLGLMPSSSEQTEAAASDGAAPPTRTVAAEQSDVVRTLRLSGLLEPTTRVKIGRAHV